MNQLLAAGEWEATGSTRARRYRPLSGQPFPPPLGDGVNGVNGMEQLAVDDEADS
jgi:hypothetical protein